MTDSFRIDDLAAPVLPAGFAEQARQMEPLAARIHFEPDALIEQAARDTGREDFGPDGWQPGLTAVLAGLRDDVPLSSLGKLSAYAQVLQFLKNRLLLEDLIRRNPEIEQVEMEPPLVIAGLPRSGTTHLHSLVAADLRFRSLPWWEALEPVLAEAERPSGEAADPRLARAAEGIAMRDQVLPHFNAMHEMTVDHVHEEIHLLALDMGTMYFENLGTGMLPTYRDHYLAEDQTPHYRYLRRVLQALQWLRGGTRWVLKSPQHLEQVPAIFEVFPDAVLATAHRDPVSTVASFATMIAYSSRLGAAKTDPVAIGHYWADRIETMLRRCVETRDQAPAERSIDVIFHEYMGSELEMVERIYGRVGIDLTPEARGQLRDYQASHPRGRFGRVLYDLADFDLDPLELRERFRFYTDRFPVRLEH